MFRIRRGLFYLFSGTTQISSKTFLFPMPPDRWKIFVPIRDKSDFQLKEPPPDLPRSSEGASPLIHQISWEYLLPDDLVRSEEQTRLPSPDTLLSVEDVFLYPAYTVRKKHPFLS